MSQQGNVQQIVVGSLVAVGNSLDSGRWLGLVVDQEAGKKWADRDPCIEHYVDEKNGPLLVRVMGTKTIELAGIGKSSLPKEEPKEVETVRWAYVQTKPNTSVVVAGPDVDSVEKFLWNCWVINDLGAGGITFFSDLKLLVEYLRGVTREPDAISYYERKFFAMLEEVLPQQR